LKKKVLPIICLILLTFAGCQADSDYGDEGHAAFSQTQSQENIVQSPSRTALPTESPNGHEPFTSFTFKYNDGEDKYIVTITQSDDGKSLMMNIEDNSFNLSDFFITAPVGYALNIPASSALAYEICEVIQNTIDDTPFTEILQFEFGLEFGLNDYSDDSQSPLVKKFYAVRNGQMQEIKLIDKTDGTARALPYAPEETLRHTELNVLMPEPRIFEEEGERIRAEVEVYRFNPSSLTMVKEPVDSSAENPLYYGYACHSAANEAYRYFAQSNLTISDWDDYVEIPFPDAEQSSFFYRVDDPRFPNVEALRNYARSYFSENIVETMFLTAPQRYRDINGALYTLYESRKLNPLLGRLTITGWVQEEDGITYYTRQEKLDESGGFSEFVDGGDFTVIQTPEGFLATQYRFSR